VIVSNPRKVRAIYQHERKSDRRDALMLARIGRMDRTLLYPVRHGSEDPDLVVKDEDGKVSTVRYEAVNAMLSTSSSRNTGG
jgi:hypothetical protein